MSYATATDMARALVRMHSDAKLVRSIVAEHFNCPPSVRTISALRRTFCKQRKRLELALLRPPKSERKSTSKFDPWQPSTETTATVEADMRAASAELLSKLRKEHRKVLKRLESQGRQVVW